MSREIITDKKTLNEINQIPNVINKSTKRVDINDLLHRARIEKTKEKKENYIFLGLVCSAVAITGVIASL